MVVGSTYREDYERGIPLIAPVLESLSKLDRYKEATIGSAEQVAKIAYYIYHAAGTGEENPIPTVVTRGLGLKIDVDGVDEAYKEQVAETTNNTAINMPAGSELRALTQQGDLYFKEFYDALFNVICAALGIPPEVASDKYDSNFSSARAALKSWEHTLNVRRKRFADQFYKPFYEFWIETSALEGTIQLDDFLTNLSKNRMVKLALLNSKFVGVNIPHIDPLKEVEAARAKLGNKFVPLTTVEEATESVNGGDYRQNFDQYRTEQEESKDLNVQPEKSNEILPATEKKKEKKELEE
jgi:capsid protein